MEFKCVEEVKYWQFEDYLYRKYRTCNEGETWEYLDEEYRWQQVTRYNEERDLQIAYQKFWGTWHD